MLFCKYSGTGLVRDMTEGCSIIFASLHWNFYLWMPRNPNKEFFCQHHYKHLELQRKHLEDVVNPLTFRS